MYEDDEIEDEDDEEMDDADRFNDFSIPTDNLLSTSFAGIPFDADLIFDSEESFDSVEVVVVDAGFSVFASSFFFEANEDASRGPPSFSS